STSTGNADLAKYDCRFSVVAGHTLEVPQLVIRLIGRLDGRLGTSVRRRWDISVDQAVASSGQS
ncbi:MAG: hypothetical protein WCD60_24170, partial [Pseudolabrys sp.]